MGKRAPVLVLLIFFIAVTAVACGSGAEACRKRTLCFFETNRELLESDIESGGSSAGIDGTFYDGEHPITEYIVVSRGTVSASSYYGIFYSQDGTPAAFQNADLPLTPLSDDEWEWRAEGDNRGIVRRLDGNWFYFEAYL